MPHPSHRDTDSPPATPIDAPEEENHAATGRDPAPPGLGAQLPLPHERDESISTTPTGPDAVIEQAMRDIATGKVDTDMRATPGLDAANRAAMVPGPGGKPAAAVPPDTKTRRSPGKKVIRAVPPPSALRGKRT